MTAVESLREALADRYSIEREIGAGGMATVYLARDLRHERDVAVKVLKPELGAVLGTERFLSEIRVTAKLQHPNLLPLFDSGTANGLLFYVMPFVEGESLRARLDREQQLPVDEAVRIATAVASALDYAHRHGVIHRDLKPENILLSEDQPLVADFGIALAVSNAGGQRVTQSGLSLGTPQYMSPEQATGDRVIDGRTDVYSLGAITYEMLAGEPPHTGSTVQAIIAKLMMEEPRPLTMLRRSVPHHIDDAVRCALEKLPADRPATAHAFAEALADPAAARTPGRRIAVRRDTTWYRFAPLIAGVAIVATLVATWALVQLAHEPPRLVLRSVIPLDPSEALNGPLGRIALSPDGSRIVYTGGPRLQLFLRDRSQLEAVPLPGTEAALSPVFSPDGERIAFVTGNTLKVLSTHGGPPVTVTDALVGRDGVSWGTDGYLYVDGQGSSGLVRVRPQPGAVPKRFTALDRATAEISHEWPDILPNGKGVLFTVLYPTKGMSGAAIAIADSKTGKHTVLLKGMHPRYSSSGHLLYVTANGTLMMVPFDQRSLQIRGEPIAVTDGLRIGMGMADLAVSRNGTLLYVTGSGLEKRQMVWVDRAGKVEQVDATFQAKLGDLALSPDGKRVAFEVMNDANFSEIWTKGLGGEPPQKLTVDGGGRFPSWTPDGQSVTYAVNSEKGYQIWTKRADGGTAAVRQVNADQEFVDPRWSPDGKWLVFRTRAAGSRIGGIYGMRPGVDTAPIPLVGVTSKTTAATSTQVQATDPAISPDGRWLAYVSMESNGQRQVYVVSFPNTTVAKWAVSASGGMSPAWAHHTGELFYEDPDGNIISVAVKTSPTFSTGRATVLFKAPGFSDLSARRWLQISPDDRRFLMLRPVDSNTPDRLIVVDNWFEELKAKSRK